MLAHLNQTNRICESIRYKMDYALMNSNNPEELLDRYIPELKDILVLLRSYYVAKDEGLSGITCFNFVIGSRDSIKEAIYKNMYLIVTAYLDGTISTRGLFYYDFILPSIFNESGLGEYGVIDTHLK